MPLWTEEPSPKLNNTLLWIGTEEGLIGAATVRDFRMVAALSFFTTEYPVIPEEAKKAHGDT